MTERSNTTPPGVLDSAPVHTLTVVLSLDFSNNTVVKWRVTKSILEELCEEKGGRGVRPTCRTMVSNREILAHLSQSGSPGFHSPHI